MNRIDIKADGPVEVTVNGLPYEMNVPPEPMPTDRVSVDMTEREAELVRSVVTTAYPNDERSAYPNDERSAYPNDERSVRGVANHHTWLIACALQDAGCHFVEHFDGVLEDASGRQEESGYALAVRMGECGGLQDPQMWIRLTMDRDVAVTLRELINKVQPYNELEVLLDKFEEAGIEYDWDKDRFTGTIKWKKKRLKAPDLDIGKAYKLVGRGRFGAADYEWEPVE